ncbi:fructose-bisphosphate aldolase class II [Faecalicatena orotica]|uniref:Fructose-bisphosphate aldolase class II n=1 Tax=Faecalicatena orotica TaxID=1544 RepID=A0A2Y9C4C1_9FIRM|nr:class II fructose-bisphosphate aldolase [Faecalicatena orotica]PWJ32328.1 fructose-bisphosphate aldolase class II [Faecalicatena orotica]SSA54162.1 fructose-bisphosphate aldolase, class II [Faecalicatena orotica]
MLVTLKEILNLCEAKGCAVGSFNTPNLESIMAVIGAAEELNVPVIIQHAQVHEEIMPLATIGPIMLELASQAKVPVAVHIDHGETVEYIYRALNLGFTSVMYDGSTLPFEENAANTRLVVSLAKRTGASVEAEIGCMGRRETGAGSAGAGNDPEKIYTDPGEAKRFVELTGIDALACSFGTTHGVYISKPKLDFSVVEKVRKNAGIPVVMHGGSGVSQEDFRTAIQKGVRKVNYYTYMAMAGGETIVNQFRMGCIPVEKNGKKYKYCYSLMESDKDVPVMYHDIVQWGTQAMKENCKKAMEIFAMK